MNTKDFNYPQHGVSIALYSLQSNTSYGIGEYFDLIKLFPWLKSLGFHFVHLLPINDLGDQSNPYKPISPFALNPLFLSLTQIAHASQKKELYHKSKINYTSVRKFKETLLVKFYLDHGERVSQTGSFTRFVEDNPWVIPYSESKSGDPKFHRFVQFLCFEQMEEVKKAAHEHDIKIMIELTGHMNEQWKERLATVSKYADIYLFDGMVDEKVLSKVHETSNLLPIVRQHNSFGICETKPYSRGLAFQENSLTYIAGDLDEATRYDKLKECHHTQSLFHLTPLHEHLNGIPDYYSKMSEDRWSFCIEPNIENFIKNKELKKVIIECLA